MTVRFAVLVSGTGSNLQALIDAIEEGRLDARIAVVISNRRAAYGLVRAERAGIPTEYHPLKPYREDRRVCNPAYGEERGRRAYDADLAEIVRTYEPDYVVLAGWMHILSSAFLVHFPDRVVNLHPALPGAFAGPHAIEDAFAAFQRGEIRCTGVMVHLVPDERVDEGPVLETAAVPIHQDDTLDSLTARVHEAEHDLLVTVLQKLVKQNAALH